VKEEEEEKKKACIGWSDFVKMSIFFSMENVM
jgi:hypothetical protein